MNGNLQDRTAELAATIKSMRSRKGLPNERPLQHEPSPFHKTARNIGKSIGDVYTKLDKLSLLVSNKGLYGDRPVEIQELTSIIKQDTAALNRAISKLQDFLEENYGRSRRTHLEKHSHNIVVALQSRLAQATTRFQEILEKRTNNLKAARQRRTQFAGQGFTPTHSSMPTLLASASADESASGDTAIDMTQSMMMYSQEESYVQERATAMENIESTISELGQIFQQLAEMIQQQGEKISRIDDNVEHASMDVEQGHNELLKHLQNISSNRWLMLKIFGVLIFFFIFFVVFLA